MTRQEIPVHDSLGLYLDLLPSLIASLWTVPLGAVQALAAHHDPRPRETLHPMFEPD